MNQVRIVAHVKRGPDEVYGMLSDFKSYPNYGGAIISVDVEPTEDGCAKVTWQAKLRDGVLSWTEKDRFDPEARTIRFEQVEGDLEVFEGAWQVETEGDGSRVSFSANFELGSPSLAAFLGPVAGQALQENIQSVLTGFFGDQISFSDD